MEEEEESKTRARTTAEVSEWAIQMTESQPSLVTSERIVALRAWDSRVRWEEKLQAGRRERGD